MKLTGSYTKKGAEMAAAAVAQSKSLTVTRAVAGSGNTASSATALSQIRQEIALVSKSVKAGACVIEALLEAEQAAEKYTLTEIGLYAKVGSGTEALYKVFRMDEGLMVEPETDLSITFFLTEQVLLAGQVQVVLSKQGFVTAESLSSQLEIKSEALRAEINAHKEDSSAHASLFAGKAEKVHTHPAGQIQAGTLAGRVAANSNTDYAVEQVRNIILSQEDPTGGSNGSIWIQYQ